jgi:adenosylcobyric acid synthase
MLRHISNYTDFNVLEQDPRVHLFYTNNVDDIRQSDIIILPGTKSTLSDLYELRRNGCAQAIIQAHREGAMVLGICGGYQMLGQEVCDPQHVEGDIERLPGLGLLPITTTMEGEKVTRQTEFLYHGQLLKGYEIHMGQTTAPPDGGYVWEGHHCLGTYIHGILDNAAFIDRLLEPFKEKIQKRTSHFDYQTYKEEQYNRLADHVRRHVDMDKIYELLTHD